LAAAGVRVEDAILGASELRRAQETAAALFGGGSPEDLKNQEGITIFPFFTEYGAIPENTPAGRRYVEPDLGRFLAAVRETVGDSGTGRPVIVVGHGSFLKTKVWPTLTGREWRGPFRNLDAFVVDVNGGAGKVIRYTGVPMNTVEVDRCRVKIATSSREMRRQTTKKHSRSRKQKGGASMPLAWYSQGAQMEGTHGYETGVGLAQPESGWVRAPLIQTQSGGKRRMSRKQKSSRKQKGGFSPAVMGSFATSGLRLLPIAAYMGHRLIKNSRKKRHTIRRK
jgi:broad specificity phosphatase PhoE